MTGQASPGRWVQGGGLADRRYAWSQCSFCGRAAEHDCRPATCPLCGSTTCFNAGTECGVCFQGLIPGWSRTAERSTCGYRGCDGDAVAKASRVGQVCTRHVARVKLRLAGRTVPLLDYVRERLAERDAGSGWQRWRWQGPDPVTPQYPDPAPGVTA